MITDRVRLRVITKHVFENTFVLKYIADQDVVRELASKCMGTHHDCTGSSNAISEKDVQDSKVVRSCCLQTSCRM